MKKLSYGLVAGLLATLATHCGGESEAPGDSGGTAGQGGSGGKGGGGKSGSNGKAGSAGSRASGGSAGTTGGDSGASGEGGGESGGASGDGGSAGAGAESGVGAEGGMGATGGGAAGAAGSGGSGPNGEDRLSVDLSFTSLLPNEQEFITVSAIEDGATDSVSAESSDTAIATVSVVGTTLVVTAGTTHGEAAVTVTSGAGLTKTVAVLVSDPRALKIGDDLLIAFVDDYDLLYSDSGSGGDLDGSYWAPRVRNGFYALGHFGHPGYANPSDGAAMVVAKALSSDALAAPTGYTWIWDDSGSGASLDGAFWRPNCPENYKAMGAVGSPQNHAEPSTDAVRCVRQDLLEPAAVGELVWHDGGTGSDNDFASWFIAVPPGTDSIGTFPLISGGFVALGGYTKPASDPVANLLRLTIPVVREMAPSNAFPKLASLLPPEETTPVERGRAVLIPFTSVTDTARTFAYKVDTSPFYRLERDVYYRRLVHHFNSSSVDQTVSHAVTTGVSTERSEEFSITTGISITVESGISFVADASASVTVSLELGYSSSTTIGEFTEESVNKDVVVPPNSAAALWQLVHRFTMKRRNGNAWETVGTPWEIGINSFVVDQYPD